MQLVRGPWAGKGWVGTNSVAVQPLSATKSGDSAAPAYILAAWEGLQVKRSADLLKCEGFSKKHTFNQRFNSKLDATF